MTKQISIFTNFYKKQPIKASAMSNDRYESGPQSVDSLTNLLGETAFLERLDYRLSTEPPDGLGILYMDIEALKAINTHFGHQETGNLVIIAAARSLESITRSEDVLASRLHGDEFGLLFNLLTPDIRGKYTTSRPNSEEFKDSFASFQARLRQNLPDLLRKELRDILFETRLRDILSDFEDGPAVRADASAYAHKRVAEIYKKIPRLGITIGGALWEEGDTAHSLLKKADDAMRTSKQDRKAAYLRRLPRRRRAAYWLADIMHTYATGEDFDRL